MMTMDNLTSFESFEYNAVVGVERGRLLADAAADNEEEEAVPLWEVIFTVTVIIVTFAVLMTDRVATDCVMLTALTAFYVSGVITIKEALAGFSSQGLLTVLALFCVAEGLNKTGALNWYVGKLLGSPTTVSGAQLRVMVPIVLLSGFINDTPLVTVALPSVISWARKIQISPRYLLMPLSFAALLGGVCTLIGTSTNMIIAGLLQDRYTDNPEFQNMSLFALGQYGVPVALLGMTYILLVTPWLMARGKHRLEYNQKHLLGGGGSSASLMGDFSDVLLGARLTQWSPAAGRTVQRSGLRDTGGIYLVRVKRSSTGNVHHAVGPDFVLQVGDVLYFTGLVETFGDFCAEHGLEVVTNEVDIYDSPSNIIEEHCDIIPATTATIPGLTTSATETEFLVTPEGTAKLSNVYEDEVGHVIEVYDDDIGYTIEGLLDAEPEDCMRVIYHMQDAIRGEAHAYSTVATKKTNKQDRVVITKATTAVDHHHNKELMIVIALDTKDRSGLMLDVSKCLARLNLDIYHTEAAVRFGNRSLSIWRCKSKKCNDMSSLLSMENNPSEAAKLKDFMTEVWSVLQALLAKEAGVAAVKQRGLRVIRALVVPHGRLVGTTAAQMNFRRTYKAAIVAIRKNSNGSVTATTGNNDNNNNNGGDELTESLADVTFEAGDALVLQVSDDSALLKIPPKDFYQKISPMMADDKENASNNFFGFGCSRGSSGKNNGDDNNINDTVEMGLRRDVEALREQEAVWRDLQVLLSNDEGADNNNSKGEFLTAMKVCAGSRLSGKTVVQLGIDKLPDVFLVDIERPVNITPNAATSLTSYGTIVMSQPLQDGDVLWFSCKNASSVGDLRKIPGLISYQTEEVEKMKARPHERCLVQAVVARKGGLVGKTVKDVRFRTQYGAAVIAVQREGHRVHEHPGNIKLQAGDVLLLEAGPSFLTDKVQNDRSFALLAEVKNSAPPRMAMLIPAIILTVAAYACYMAKVTQLIGCAMVAVILMVACGILSQNEARDAIRWEIYLTIASAYGIGTALVNSGVAAAVADFLVRVGNATGFGEAGLLGAVYLGTVLISQLVANNAAAALIFPIAMDAAESTGTDLTIMSYTIMLAASAAFMTPFGYQTNLMVMGPGGYSTADFLIFGTPMQLVLCVATTVYLVSPLWICWVVSFGIFVAAAIYRVWTDLRAGKPIRRAFTKTSVARPNMHSSHNSNNVPQPIRPRGGTSVVRSSPTTQRRNVDVDTQISV